MTPDNIKCFNEPILKRSMKKFEEILYSTGGRYFNRPRSDGEYFRVDFVYGDHEAHVADWKHHSENNKHIRRDHWTRKIFLIFIHFITKIKYFFHK